MTGENSTELMKLVTEEFRFSSERIEQLRKEHAQRINALESYIQKRLDRSEHQHKDLLAEQKLTAQRQAILVEQHKEMNAILMEHIRRTAALEKLVAIEQKKLENFNESIDPVREFFSEQQIIERHEKTLQEERTKRLKKSVMIIGGISTTVGVVATILSWFGVF